MYFVCISSCTCTHCCIRLHMHLTRRDCRIVCRNQHVVVRTAVLYDSMCDQVCNGCETVGYNHDHSHNNIMTYIHACIAPRNLLNKRLLLPLKEILP